MTTTANAHVASTLALYCPQLPLRFVQAVQQLLTVQNPEREQMARAGLSGGHLPATLQLWRQDGDWLHVPRGAVKRVKQQASLHEAQLRWSSAVVSRAPSRVHLDDLTIQLRPYQREAVDAMLFGVQGHVVAPCGAGKTVIASTALAVCGEPGIVLVHTHDLLEQWVRLLRGWGYRVRVVSGGQSRFAPLGVHQGQPELCVAMVQTLARAGDAAEPLLSSAGAVVLDECHHAPASTFRELLNRIPARHRWGVTATPERGDGLTVMLELALGEQLYEITTQQLLDGGYLMQPIILPVFSAAHVDLQQCTTQNGQLVIAKAVKQLVDDAERHQLLLQLATVAAEAGRTTLLLVPRVEQAQRIAHHLRARGVLAADATSATGKGQRLSQLRQLRQRQLQVLVATQLADEGLDVPALDCLIVASTGRAAGRAVQRIGRVMRTADGKGQPIVIDIVDPTPFRGQWRAREQAYREALGLQVPPPTARSQAVDALRRLVG